jgi:hypothetical protein
MAGDQYRFEWMVSRQVLFYGMNRPEISVSGKRIISRVNLCSRIGSRSRHVLDGLSAILDGNDQPAQSLIVSA